MHRYRGFCLSAITLLPINSQTLLYGSSDAGLTIHTEDARLNALMAQLGSKLNLMGREVQGTQVFTPMDIEGHLVCELEWQFSSSSSSSFLNLHSSYFAGHGWSLLLHRLWPSPTARETYSLLPRQRNPADQRNLSQLVPAEFHSEVSNFPLFRYVPRESFLLIHIYFYVLIFSSSLSSYFSSSSSSSSSCSSSSSSSSSSSPSSSSS
jgi:hypothetical protein